MLDKYDLSFFRFLSYLLNLLWKINRQYLSSLRWWMLLFPVRNPAFSPVRRLQLHWSVHLVHVQFWGGGARVQDIHIAYDALDVIRAVGAGKLVVINTHPLRVFLLRLLQFLCESLHLLQLTNDVVMNFFKIHLVIVLLRILLSINLGWLG